LPEAALAIPRRMLGSGFRLNLVRQVAAAAQQHRGTESRRVQRTAGFTGKELAAMSKATFAAVLLSVSARSVEEISMLAGYSRTTYLTDLLRRVFGRSAREIRADVGSRAIDDWLAEELQAAHARAVRSRRPTHINQRERATRNAGGAALYE
jgi:AraC-like DNA-binding protein